MPLPTVTGRITAAVEARSWPPLTCVAWIRLPRPRRPYLAALALGGPDPAALGWGGAISTTEAEGCWISLPSVLGSPVWLLKPSRVASRQPPLLFNFFEPLKIYFNFLIEGILDNSIFPLFNNGVWFSHHRVISKKFLPFLVKSSKY